MLANGVIGALFTYHYFYICTLCTLHTNIFTKVQNINNTSRICSRMGDGVSFAHTVHSSIVQYPDDGVSVVYPIVLILYSDDGVSVVSL